MKRNLPHVISSAVSALLIANMAMPTTIFNVSAIDNPLGSSDAYILSKAENGHLYTNYGNLVCDAESLSIYIENGESILTATGSGMIIEIEKEPITSEEILEVKKLSNGISGRLYLAKDTLNVFLIKPEKDGTYVKSTVLHDPEIKYTINADIGEIFDYKTNTLLQNFDKIKGFFVRSEKKDFSNFLIYDSEQKSFYSNETPSNNLYYMGDIDRNGIVDLTDLTTLSLHLVGDKEFTDDMLAISDMTNDGAVNIADLATMKQYIMNAL